MILTMIEQITFLQITNKTKECPKVRNAVRTQLIMRNEHTEIKRCAQRHYYIVRSLYGLAEGYKQLRLI